MCGEDERDEAKSEPMPGGALNMEDVEEHVEALFDCMKRVRRKYEKWITEVALHASWRLAQACNEGELVDEDLPRGQERQKVKV